MHEVWSVFIEIEFRSCVVEYFSQEIEVSRLIYEECNVAVHGE